MSARLKRHVIYFFIVFVLFSVARLEIDFISKYVRIESAFFNFDYLLIFATPWPSVAFVIIFLIDVLWGICRGGFWGISDLPVIMENSLHFGFFGLLALTTFIGVLFFNILVLTLIARRFSRFIPGRKDVIFIFFAISTPLMMIRTTLPDGLNSLFGSQSASFIKNILTNNFYQEMFFGGTAKFEKKANFSLLKVDDLTNKRILLVIFESWGLDNNGHYISMVKKHFSNKKIEITNGSFKGPTVYGELRELCSAIPTSLNISITPGDCLPEYAKKNGFITTAFHGNSAAFYRRDRWMGGVGFDFFYDRNLILQKNPDARTFLNPQFNSISDEYMMRFIGDMAAMRNAQKEFYYFLSLDSHGPYKTTPNSDCNFSDQFRGELCDYFQKIDTTLSLISEFSAKNPDFKIFVIGDHNPYLLANESNINLFSKSQVPAFIVHPSR